MGQKDTYESLKEQGRLALDNEDYNSALTIFKKALTLEPNNPEALKNIGVSYFHLNNTKQARKYYRKALAIQPNYWRALHNLGHTFKSTKALNCYRDSIKLAPQHPLPYVSLGQRLGKIGRHKEAIIFLEKGLQIQTKRPSQSLKKYWVHFELGCAYYSIEKYKKAKKHFKKALNFKPDHYLSTLWLARNYYFQGNFENCVILFQEYLNTHPTFEDYIADIHFYMGYAYSQLNNPLLASEHNRQYKRLSKKF